MKIKNLELVSRGEGGRETLIIVLGFLSKGKKKRIQNEYINAIRLMGFRGEIYLFLWGTTDKLLGIINSIFVAGTKRLPYTIVPAYIAQWKIAKNNAFNSSKDLSNIIRELKLGKRNISLLGHSLGAYVILESLMRFREGKMVKKAVLMGAAAGKKRDWNYAILRVEESIVNVYDKDDLTLKILYPIGELFRDVAIGCRGINKKSSRIVNINATELMYEKALFHGEYIKCLNSLKIKL